VTLLAPCVSVLVTGIPGGASVSARIGRAQDEGGQDVRAPRRLLALGQLAFSARPLSAVRSTWRAALDTGARS